MTQIKICGLRRMEDVECANRYLPNYVGFMFVPTSRRRITLKEAVEFRSQLLTYVQAVGVFQDQDLEEICKVADSGAIEVVQLHGSEDADFIRAVQKRTGLPVIKAFRVDSKESLLAAQDSPADFVLLDNGAGGTGEAFDWSLLEAFPHPYFLAGGLSPQNISEVIRKLAPYGVDVSSGVETDGFKDIQKIRGFIGRIRETDADGT